MVSVRWIIGKSQYANKRVKRSVQYDRKCLSKHFLTLGSLICIICIEFHMLSCSRFCVYLWQLFLPFWHNNFKYIDTRRYPVSPGRVKVKKANKLVKIVKYILTEEFSPEKRCINVIFPVTSLTNSHSSEIQLLLSLGQPFTYLHSSMSFRLWVTHTCLYIYSCVCGGVCISGKGANWESAVLLRKIFKVKQSQPGEVGWRG